MSEYVFFSLLLGGALTVLWGAYRFAALGCRVIGRVALLSLLPVALLAAAIPFLLAKPEVITVSAVPVSASVAVPAPEIGESIVDAMPESEPEAEPTTLWSVINTVYIVGVCLSFLYMLFTLVRISGIIRRSEREEKEVRLRLHDCDSLVPFAWGRWIVMSRADYCANGPMLMAHERMHLHCAHWLDLLVLNFLQCLTWYWPAIWLIRRELVAAHEAEADRAVLSAGFPAEEYQMLLIKKASGRRFANSATVGINHSLIKSRIIMMKKPISAARRNLRALALVPACLLVLLAATLPVLASKASGYLPAIVEKSDLPEPTVGAVDSSLVVYIDGEKRDSVYMLTSDKAVDVTAIYAETEVQAHDRSDATTELDDVEIYINGAKSSQAAYSALSPDQIYSVTVDKTVEPAALYVKTKDSITVRDRSSDATTELDDVEIYINGAKSSQAAYSALSPDQIASIAVVKTVEPAALYVETKDYQAAKVVDTPDVNPEFPGGEFKMYEYLVKNMRYPIAAADKGIQGVVYVKFIVFANGKIGNVEVDKGVDPELDAEAVRVVKSFPDWIPGKVNGKPVNVNFVVPLSFKLTY